MEQLQGVANRQRKAVFIYLDDVVDHFIGAPDGDEFVARIEGNTMHFVSLFCNAVDRLLPQPSVPLLAEDALDVILQQRRAQHEAAQQAGDAPAQHNYGIPPELQRRYELYIVPTTKAGQKERAVRAVLAEDIGHLVTVRGMVTRVTDVRPLVAVATYTCEVCGNEVFQTVNAPTFMPLDKCPSNRCQTNRDRGRLVLQTRGSRFVRTQEMRLQELPDQVPVGHIPRAMTVMLRGVHTRALLPGDIVSVAGVFLPRPVSAMRAQRGSSSMGLLADTYLETMHIQQHKQRNVQDDLDASDDMAQRVQELRRSPHLYERLASSIAPEIFGHPDVKKALLLLLVAGATRTLTDGMKLRGDINVCLMGDPGVAKSQLLRFIAAVAPRAVYTSGRGSSGAGLTAAIMRDPVTKEMTLEGGALVLADMGVCCIDEFDKMQDQDRTAIHEVMEQQTVSIAKAGITTTLNARTAVLAAANPLYGRYNLRRSPAENINMPAALLSRFDLLFLVLDKPDPGADRQLAAHVLHVHRFKQHPPSELDPVPPPLMRAYIAKSRTFVPVVPEALHEYIVKAYVELRRQDSRNFVVTARTLMCVLRLAQALARLQHKDTVAKDDVDEALRLLRTARASLEPDAAVRRPAADATTAIYHIIRDAADELQSGTVRLPDVLDTIRLRGFSDAQLQQCLDEYQRINVWQVAPGRDAVTFV